MKVTKFAFEDICNFGNFILKIKLRLATLTFWRDIWILVLAVIWLKWKLLSSLFKIFATLEILFLR